MDTMERSITPSSVKEARLAEAQRALLLAKRLRNASALRADSSTFSALNIEHFQRQTSSSSMFSEKGESAFGRQTSAQFGRQLSSSLTFLAKAKVGPDTEALRLALQKTSTNLAKPNSRQVSQVAEPPSFQDVRNDFLRYRNVDSEDQPAEIANLTAALVQPKQPSPVSAPVLEAQGFVTPRPTAVPTPTPRADIPAGPPGVFNVSPKAGSPYQQYCPPTAESFGMTPHPMATPRGFSGDATPSVRPRRQSVSENDDIKRSVQSLLNKVCPENVATIVERISAIEVKDATQLEIIIESIFRKALMEPHYCETYADLVFSLKSVFPQFPSPNGGKPMTFKSSVLNVCQNEFEELVASAEPIDEEAAKDMSPEELEHQRRVRKERMRANMKFIGHLFLRQLLSAKVISSVICELVLCIENTDHVPEEHAIECACELLTSIGYTLEQLPTGNSALQLVCNRLFELKARKAANGKGVYCKRITFMIQDLLDTRAAGWSMKTFKSSAKTKEEIRMEQARDLEARSRGIESPMAEHVVAGQRPVYLSPGCSA